MRILVSNDDGIYSPGIATLAEVAAELGEVRVVAPDMERSSSGHSITASRPLSYRATRVGSGFSAYRVDGTPADCVALGAHLWGQVDLVLSGLNSGLNLGSSIWHSGTLAAAKQACMLGLRGVALSAPSSADPDFAPYKPWLREAIRTVLATPLRLVNVNVPRDPRGLIWTRVSVRQYDGKIVPTHDPMGRELYWFTVTPLQGAEEGTDRWALEQGWTSLTPLHLDLTDERGLAEARRLAPLDETRAHTTSPARSSPEAAKSVREEEARAPLEDHAGAATR